VLEAESVAAALEIGESFAGPIDLLLTDVVMPEMSGREDAARLAARRPEMRILYMSGFADEDVVRRGVLSAGQALVAKPFTMVRLTHEVRRALRS
jgi:CheY-like chemotaxis protein